MPSNVAVRAAQAQQARGAEDRRLEDRQARALPVRAHRLAELAEGGLQALLEIAGAARYAAPRATRRATASTSNVARKHSCCSELLVEGAP